ncbi:universal stress protein [Thermococcus peptonophilus]|uniref:Universal stress protein n=1 Tax=Thermococcus peptonophilus TaxID=53952 RepID=A0A142CUY6_9EURY|nr:universal stress protein [Thermococcus peptonophilus]AMQ18588.1 universal stress protein [Thermococcus peptonophilus]
MFEKILYPTDFSDISLHALHNCLPDLFELGAKELYLLHVIDITVAELQAFELEEIYKNKLEELAKTLRETGIDVKTSVRIGIPSLEIAEEAESIGADLIISPSVGENVWRQMFLGSTASNLVRATKRPVLLLKYSKKDDSFELPVKCSELFQRPLVALDFSECSEKITNAVEKFREQIEKGILLHSVDYGKIDELEKNIDAAKKRLDEVAEKLGVEFEKEVMVGTASQAIIGTALAKKATLIVIGKKGRSIIKELILGSTAERVIRDSKLPVLLVPCE